MSEIISPQTIVLASSSPTRQRLLQAAGVPFKAIPASVDETAIRETLMTEGQQIDPLDVAEVLARAKAEDVSAKHPGCVVIGADQVLACDGQIISKPQTIDAARDVLDEDFTPLTDWRATAEYRQLTAKNLLTRFFLETSGQKQELSRFSLEEA